MPIYYHIPPRRAAGGVLDPSNISAIPKKKMAEEA